MTKSVRDVSFHANIIEKNVMLRIINIIIDVTFFYKSLDWLNRMKISLCRENVELETVQFTKNRKLWRYEYEEYKKSFD